MRGDCEQRGAVPPKFIETFQAMHDRYRSVVTAECSRITPAFAGLDKQDSAVKPSEHRQSLARKYGDRLATFLHEWGLSTQAAAADHTLFTRLRNQEHVLRLIYRHVSHGAVSITRQAVDEAQVALDAVVNELAQLYAHKHLSFPWKKLYYTDGGLEMMARLRQFKPRFDTQPCTPHNIYFTSRAPGGTPLFPLNYQGGYLSIVHADTDYESMDVLVDLYQEQARLSARRQDTAKAPLETWADPAFVRAALADCFRHEGAVTLHILRERIYKMVKECTQFKPSLVVAAIRHFGSRRMLDFSAGWGDRLAGAIAAGVERYYAFDPNTALTDGHQALVHAFVPADQHAHFTVQYAGVEVGTFPAGSSFDLVFTSPPFFDFEIYTHAPGQSVDKYRSLNAWLVHFLFVALAKAWSVLVPGGNCVIHITDVFKTKVCEAMCLFVAWRLPGAHYLGVMCSRGLADKPRPLWVFQKDPSKAPAVDKSHAASEMARCFPDVHAEVLRMEAEKQ